MCLECDSGEQVAQIVQIVSVYCDWIVQFAGQFGARLAPKEGQRQAQVEEKPKSEEKVKEESAKSKS